MTKTQGFVLTQFGKPETAFQLQTIELQYNDDQILVEVSAFGLNYADIMARIGKYRETPPLPTTIGYEVVGKIVEVGKNLDVNLIGKRVLAFSQFGGYAQHAVIENEAFIALEDSVSDENALALCTQYVTAYYMAMYQSLVRAHDVVLVHAAAGGVGLGLVQMCKNLGATVIAKIGDDSKVERLKSLGVDKIVNYNKADYEQEIRSFLGEKRLTYSFNPVGGTTFKKDMRLLGATGKIVLFGGSELSNGKFGVLSQLNFVCKMGFPIPAFLMMQSKSVLGVNMLKVALEYPHILKECMNEVQKLHHSGKLQTFVDNIYNFNELADAHHRLESGKSSGKLVVRW
ncbi:MAG TPA: zinc-binding dehydrogenase [Crocinitomicaceae bacterium]|nr:zinc-binding dehydrogenase [Crocinitomicaceae bacterium]